MHEPDQQSGAPARRGRCRAPGARSVERMRTVGGPAWQLPALLLFGAAISQVVAAIVLASAARDLAHGLFLGMPELELVHLYGLATLSVAIFAVQLQLIPVILRERVPLEWLAALAATALLIGGWVMAIALSREQTNLAGLGGALVGAGGAVLVTLVGTALVRAARARRLGDTGLGFCMALVWFVVVIGLGGSLLDNLRTPLLGTLTLRVMGAHALIAGLGWIGGTIVATVLRLGPMLALAHGHSQRPGRIALVAWHLGVAGVAVGLVAGVDALVTAGAASLAAAALALGVYLAGVIRHRHRRLEAPAIHLVVGALAMMVAVGAIGAAAIGAIPVFDAVIPAGLCVLVGLGAGVTSGHLFKVLPMIVWTGRFAHLAGTGGAPRLADMYPARLARIEQAAFATGIAALVVGCLAGSPRAATVGADLIVLAAVATLVAAAMIIARTPRPAAVTVPTTTRAHGPTAAPGDA